MSNKNRQKVYPQRNDSLWELIVMDLLYTFLKQLMSNQSSKHLSILMAALLCSSCHRQSLEEGYFSTAKIPIHIDWSVCGLTPQHFSM